MIATRPKDEHRRVRLPEAESSGESDGGSERAPPAASPSQRPPFSKPAPSKWDDAQKWIASPTSNRGKPGPPPRKSGFLGYGGGRMKVVVEVSPERQAFGVEEIDTKRIDSSRAEEGSGGVKAVNWGSQGYAVADIIENSDSAV
ncbi:hypothetical protein QJS04_geneDACA009875 [Acorus gramineus]|uniref:Uncharacterized protein n=1 Tax=Acorus gramineus TaxID=55184 RepID=A0AAV9BCY1_ACOGR|nr:hypothetical protein QJS04_geneDACA009875 [Acorus gramineus]